MPETIYYEDTSARIGSEWFVFSNRTYRVRDVESVSSREVSSSGNDWISYMPYLVVFYLLIWWYTHLGEDVYGPLTYFLIPTLVPVLIWAIYMDIKKPRNILSVLILSGSFAESAAFATLDKEYRKNLIREIESALREKSTNESSPNNHTDVPLLLGKPIDITEHTVMFGENTYDLRAIKSCILFSVAFERLDLRLYGLRSITWLIWTIFAFPIWVPGNTNDPNRYTYQLLAIVAFGVTLLLWHIRNERKPVRAHVIELRGKFERVNAFATLDDTLAKGIVAEVNVARKRQSKVLSAPSGHLPD